MKNGRLTSFILWLLSVISKISYISSQCLSPDDVRCVWSHDETSQLTWKYKADAGARFIELTKCKPPDCGTATLVTPWQPPAPGDTRVTLEYKIYGTSYVYLKLYMKREDSSQPSPIFEKYGNYGDSFPTGWSSESFTIPRSNAGYRLMLKGNIPFPDAYIAVMGIRLAGSVVSEPTPGPSFQDSDILDENNDIEEETNDDRREDTNDIRNDNAFEDLEISQALEQGQYLRGISDKSRVSLLPLFAFLLHVLVQTYRIM